MFASFLILLVHHLQRNELNVSDNGFGQKLGHKWSNDDQFSKIVRHWSWSNVSQKSVKKRLEIGQKSVRTLVSNWSEVELGLVG